MANYNPDFWEIPASSTYLERIPAERGLWFETEEDRRRRHAFKDFFESVQPVVVKLIDSKLTERQKQVVELYFFYGKTQEDIAEVLGLTQSTVSRHLFGTVRDGRRVGGAIRKLRKVIEKSALPQVDLALEQLEQRLAQAV